MSLSLSVRRWLAPLLLAWLACVQLASAHLTATWNGTTLALPTMDYLMHRTPFYNRSGLAVLWPWVRNSSDCAMRPVDPNQQTVKLGATEAAQYPDTALIVYWSTAAMSGCKTLAQVGLAAQSAGKEFEQLGYPPLSLVIMIVFSNDTVPVWGPSTLMYRSTTPSIPDGPPVVDMALLNQWDSLSFYRQFRAVPFSVRFRAMEEHGVWNDAYLSPGYTMYIWLLFTLVLLAFLYALARFFRLIVLRKTPDGLRLVIVVLTFIYCVFLLAYFVITNLSFVGRIIEDIVMLLSVSALELLLWRWALRAKNVFSRITIVIFLGCVALHLLMILGLFALNAYIALTWQYEELSSAVYVLVRYVAPVIPLIGVIIFGGFAPLHTRYLVLHMRVPCSPPYRGTHTLPAVRALVCLAVTGIRWPKTKRDEFARVSLGGGTTLHVPEEAVGWRGRLWNQLASAFGRSTTGLDAAAKPPPPPPLHHETDISEWQLNDSRPTDTLGIQKMGETIHMQTVHHPSYSAIQTETIVVEDLSGHHQSMGDVATVVGSNVEESIHVMPTDTYQDVTVISGHYHRIPVIVARNRTSLRLALYTQHSSLMFLHAVQYSKPDGPI
ncbi:hypothetical protein THASP1DRAFT_22816 [Thamnocephalis sphaerospora]|uniref:Lung seven transmembrane receptor-domain-containing protein n=1 Tax=Thamnocephalis sphaerospora TaxID=78915 RepID=A0A4P9XTK6_9FUNG|nr:hypothetical protein THASP1DRAFT_22816 [Thamnocephalis sphaerospora]|eukprot:RKP09322.1 hypothetical protein THASP1DRAFT_22816 [Thamnocephalis sphaerospora]